MLLLLLFPALSFSYQVIFAVSCGGNSPGEIKGKHFTYTPVIKQFKQDSAYQPLVSQSVEITTPLPEHLSALPEAELYRTHRTVAEGHSIFTYRPIILNHGRYIAIFTMIEVNIGGIRLNTKKKGKGSSQLRWATRLSTR